MSKTLAAVVFKDKCINLGVFALIQERGNIAENEMYGTFNAGYELYSSCRWSRCWRYFSRLKSMDITPIEIGYIEDGDNQLCLR